ncbi:MAG TPA: RidA family protein, partial [Candidatus Dormibacteraeota bacterium]
MIDTASRLAELGIELPEPPTALGAYVPYVIAGDLLLTSGVVPLIGGQLRCAGVVGADLDVETAAEGARLCALNLLALMKAATGSLDAVRQVLRLDGFVRSAPGFTAQPKVLNGASELMVAVLGDRGLHTRTAVGAAELPMGAAV